ncbi:unnamed protein product [Caenorhabditis nigoni]
MEEFCEKKKTEASLPPKTITRQLNLDDPFCYDPIVIVLWVHFPSRGVSSHYCCLFSLTQEAFLPPVFSRDD